MSRPDIRLPVDVHGDLSLDGPSGHRVRLQTAGSRLRLSAPGWTELRQLGPRSLITQRRTLKATVRALNVLGLTLNIDVAGRRAFQFGTGVRTTLLARLLGLTSAEIPFSTLFNLLRSPAAVPPEGLR